MAKPLALIAFASGLAWVACSVDVHDHRRDHATAVPYAQRPGRGSFERARGVALTADHIEPFKMLDVTPDGTPLGQATGLEINGRPASYKGAPLPPDLRDQVTRILFSPESYLQSPNACVLHADVAYRFVGPDGVVDVVYCMSCRQLEAAINGESAALLSGTLSEAAGNELLALSRKALPQEMFPYP